MDPIGDWRKHGPDHPIGLQGWLIQACLNRMASLNAGWVGRLGSWGLAARMRQGPGSIPRKADLSHSLFPPRWLWPAANADRNSDRTWPSLR